MYNFHTMDFFHLQNTFMILLAIIKYLFLQIILIYINLLLHIPALLVDICIWCILRQQGSSLALPCRHVISNEMIIHSSDVHPRYLRIDKIVQKVENPLIIDHKEGHKSRSNYSDLMAQISPFAAIAAKNTEVTQAFNNFIMKLNEFKIEIRNA